MYNPTSGFGGGSTEIERYLFIQIKLLNFVEVAYIENKLADDVYRQKTNQLMEKINSLKQQLPSFNVDNYFQVRGPYLGVRAEQPQLRFHEA